MSLISFKKIKKYNSKYNNVIESSLHDDTLEFQKKI